MQILYFATHNKDKLKEAGEILGLPIKAAGFEVDEVQSLDPVEVAVKKARSYYQKLKKPIFVEDVSLSIEALNGLPGTYIDAFLKTLGNSGIIEILKGKVNRRVFAQATITYISKNIEKVFIGSVKGAIADKPRGEGFGWDPIFIPNGFNRTFGEMTLTEKNKFSMRAIALKKLKKWLELSV